MNEKANGFSRPHKYALGVQRVVAFAFFLPLYFFVWFALRVYGRMTIRDLPAVRAQFKKIVKEAKGPVILCPNHFTYIDSLVLHCALGSAWYYLFHFHALAWNVPEKKNTQKSWVFRVIAYLGKCLLVERGGSRESAALSLETMRYLLRRGEFLMIFPEGRRGLKERIDPDSVSYAVGQILENIPHAEVVCLYLRGDAQRMKSTFPKRHETFTLMIHPIFPETENTGRRAARDLSQQIIEALVVLENEYFERNLQTWE